MKVWQGRNWRGKPFLGAVVDWSNEVTQAMGLVGAWLCNDSPGDTALRNLATFGQTDNVPLSNGGAIVAGSRFQALSCVGNDVGAMLSSPSAALKPASQVTLLWYGTILGAGTANAMLAGVPANNTNVAPFASYMLRRSDASTSIILEWNNTNAYASINVANLITTGVPVMLIGTIAQGQQVLYKDGRQVGSNNGSGSIIYGGTAQFVFGRLPQALTRNSNSQCIMCLVGNKAISAGLAEELSANPFGMFDLTNRQRSWFSVVGINTTPMASDSAIGFETTQLNTGVAPILIGNASTPGFDSGGGEFAKLTAPITTTTNLTTVPSSAIAVPPGATSVTCALNASLFPSAGSSPTLDAWFQYSPDRGLTWQDFAHLQLTSNGSTNAPVSLIAPGPTTVPANSDGQLGVNSIVQGPIAGTMRAKYTTTNGGDTTNPWRFQILANFI